MIHTTIRAIAMIVSIGTLGFTTYHTRVAQEEYYNPARHGERPGFFLGETAKSLGLEGTISQEQFKALLRGFHPETGEPLIQSAGRKVKICAHDLTISASKSFSLSLAVAPDQATRDRLMETFQDTVERFLERVEAATYIRVGKDSKPVPAKPLVACFYHLSARPAKAGQPGQIQAHAHLISFRIGVAEDGRTGAILSRPYYVRSAAWSELATCDHYVALQKEFPGLRLRQTPVGPEIDGIPEEVLRHFSQRRQQIEAELGNLASSTGAARAMAALKTRLTKHDVPPEAELIARTQREAARLGFTVPQMVEILKPRSREPEQPERVLREALRQGLAQLTERDSHFSELDLVRRTAHAAAGKGVSGTVVEEYVTEQIRRSAEIEHVGELHGRRRYSTLAVLKEEQDVLRLANELAKGRSHRVTTAGLLGRLSLENVRAVSQWMTLDSSAAEDADQRRAVKKVAQDSGQLALLSAPAGTGRIETISRLGRLYEAAGYTVLGIGTTGKCVRSLAEEADVPAMSLAALQYFLDQESSLAAGAKHAAKQIVREAVGRYIGLYPFQRKPLLDEDTVVLIDGAQTMSTQSMHAVLKGVQRAGCKAVLVGSPDGLQSIERGVPFASFLKRFDAAELTEVVRPEQPRDAKNIERAGSGQTKEVLQDLHERGHLHVASTSQAAEARTIDHWVEQGGAIRPQKHLIFTTDRTTARRLNEQASAARRRKSSGKQAPGIGGSIVLPNGEKLHVGDRVLCAKTSRRYGILAGDMGTVLGVSRRLNAVQIERDTGEQVTLPLATYPDLTRGYAVTVWQARPTEHAYLLLSGIQREDRQSALTKLSQASRTTDVFVDRQTGGRELEELARQIAKDRKKTLARDVQDFSQQLEQGTEPS